MSCPMFPLLTVAQAGATAPREGPRSREGPRGTAEEARRRATAALRPVKATFVWFEWTGEREVQKTSQASTRCEDR